MTEHFKSYIPEALALQGKDGAGARICVEDCAVLDCSRDMRILQSRGIGLLPNTPLAEALGMTERERLALMDAIGSHKRFMMAVGTRALIILADWLPATGLLLAVLPHASYPAAKRAWGELGRSDLVCISDGHERATAEECRCAWRALSDTLRYTDAILSKGIAASHLLLTLAAFCGCHLQSPSELLQTEIASPLGDRLIALMLCSFLYIRSIAGTAIQEPTLPQCLLSLTYSAPSLPAYSPPPPVFLQASCFRDCYTQQADGKFSVTMPLAAELSVRAADTAVRYLVLEFQASASTTPS